VLVLADGRSSRVVSLGGSFRNAAGCVHATVMLTVGCRKPLSCRRGGAARCRRLRQRDGSNPACGIAAPQSVRASLFAITMDHSCSESAGVHFRNNYPDRPSSSASSADATISSSSS